jgi:3-mercaptopyruvate sulfurtransferase SseA
MARAANTPWTQAVKEDSPFKSADALRAFYESVDAGTRAHQVAVSPATAS